MTLNCLYIMIFVGHIAYEQWPAAGILHEFCLFPRRYLYYVMLDACMRNIMFLLIYLRECLCFEYENDSGL